MDLYRVIGIDPGQSGGIAILDCGKLEVWKMPETPADICHALEEFDEREMQDQSPLVAHVFLERVGAARGRDGRAQGIASTAKFMRGVGVIEGILTALRMPFEEVSPGVWQKSLGCLTGGDKNVSKRRAQQLYPNTKFTHATADAALLAHYGMVKLTRS